MKVINGLSRAGFLATVRGRNGGFTLARPAASIKVGDVVRFTEQDTTLVECFDARRNRCVITPACRLKTVLYDAQEAFYGVLDRHSVADLFGAPETVLRHLATAK
ncbi:MAG: Rrf2 family transcriptional regulator [Rhizobiales bacterium]|nr:Rrf2 family transcriptional regulator [Hyphomicrobiales bacterium]